MITSSTAAGSMPERSTSASSTFGGHVGRVPVLERAAALAPGGAGGGDDIG
jgi:hypothetical protein